MITVYKVKNIECANCAKKLERAIQKLPEVKSANLVFMTEKLVVESDINEELDDVLRKEIRRVMPIVEIERIS